jgi:hypothetical protein
MAMQRIFKRSENKSVRSKTSKLFIRHPLASLLQIGFRLPGMLQKDKGKTHRELGNET